MGHLESEDYTDGQAPEEARWAKRPKRCENKNKDVNISPKVNNHLFFSGPGVLFIETVPYAIIIQPLKI